MRFVDLVFQMLDLITNLFHSFYSMPGLAQSELKLNGFLHKQESLVCWLEDVMLEFDLLLEDVMLDFDLFPFLSSISNPSEDLKVMNSVGGGGVFVVGFDFTSCVEVCCV